MRRFVAMLSILLIVDVCLGIACTEGYLPLWTFALVNFPFGILHVVVESSWKGQQYVLWGRTISDTVSLAVYFLAILAQATLYLCLYDVCAALASRPRVRGRGRGERHD